MKKGSFPYDRKSYRRFPKRRKDAAIIETFDEPPFLKTLIAPQLRERVYQNIIKRLLKPINFSSLFSLLSGVFANPTGGERAAAKCVATLFYKRAQHLG